MTQLDPDKKSVRLDLDATLPVVEPPAYRFSDKGAVVGGSPDNVSPTPVPARSILSRHRGKFLLLVLFLGLVAYAHHLTRRHAHAHRHSHGRCKDQQQQLESHHKYMPNLGKAATAACNRTRQSSGPITGRFDLYDCLDLSTSAGSIDITVTPHPGHGPAVLRINTSAGSVRVRVDDSLVSQARSGGATALSALRRPVNADVYTSAGSITASWLVGNGGRTTFTSSAGELDLEILALHAGPGDAVTTLKTHTMSGQQRVRVAPLLGFAAGSSIASLVAEHKSAGSGQVAVVYPAEWEGIVDVAVYGSGGVVVEGDGLIVDRNLGSRVKAHRGKGKAEVRVESLGSGQVSFSC